MPRRGSQTVKAAKNEVNRLEKQGKNDAVEPADKLAERTLRQSAKNQPDLMDE